MNAGPSVCQVCIAAMAVRTSGQRVTANQPQRTECRKSLLRYFDGASDRFEILRVLVDEPHTGNQYGSRNHSIETPPHQRLLPRFDKPVGAFAEESEDAEAAP